LLTGPSRVIVVCGNFRETLTHFPVTERRKAGSEALDSDVRSWESTNKASILRLGNLKLLPIERDFSNSVWSPDLNSRLFVPVTIDVDRVALD
jgi:hypothetical protein